MDITYHMVPKKYFDAQDISADYFPIFMVP